MTLRDDVRLASVPTADALLVDEPIELRLLRAFRGAPGPSRVALVEIAEQLAAGRIGRLREAAVRPGAAVAIEAATNP
jgi:hypothetical protein